MNASEENNMTSPALIGGAFSWLHRFALACICASVLIAWGCNSTPGEMATTAQATREAQSAAHSSSPFISPEELTERLGESGLIIVHVGHGDRGYQRAHLPGAIYLDFDDIYVNRDVAMEMPDAPVVEAVVRKLGINDDSAVVLVGDASGVFPARFYVTLKHHGLAAELRLLDGQLKGWKAKGLPVVTEVPTRPQPSDWSANIQRRVLVTAEKVAETLAAPGTAVVLDVRPASQFTGERRGPGVDAKGRIDGAVNVPWRSMFDGSNPPWLKETDVLRGQLTAAGIAEGDSIMVYDSSGIHACLALIVLQHLGHEVSLYDGGFEAWSQR